MVFINRYLLQSSLINSTEIKHWISLSDQSIHCPHNVLYFKNIKGRFFARFSTEALRDIGYSLTFSVFDEDSVSQWDGRDLREAKDLPNVDLVVVAVKQNHLIELSDLLNADAGMMSYIRNFWRGFHPLLLIELQTMHDSAEIVSQKRKKVFYLRRS